MYHSQNNSSYSMFFGHRGFEDNEVYSCTNLSSSPSSLVDCTLSLGTPSTRLTNESNHHHEKKRPHHFGWNILSSKHTSSPSAASKSSRVGTGSSGGDPLLARRCANCDTTSTPLWRNGPRGPKSLCNACGIRYKKEERRATAAAATSQGGTTYATVDTQHNNWVQTQKMPCYQSTYGNEFRFVDDENQYCDSDSGIPFYSWHFNVADRPGLIHDFTR